MKGVKTLNHRVVNKGVASYKPLCAIKVDGNPKTLIDLLHRQGVLQGHIANPKQWYDNLYSCEMFHSAECTLMLSRYDG